MKMIEDNILEKAREFLSENIELETLSEIPVGPAFYGLAPTKVSVLRFSLFEGSGIGPSKYLAVSKQDESVQFLGYHGE